MKAKTKRAKTLEAGKRFERWRETGLPEVIDEDGNRIHPEAEEDWRRAAKEYNQCWYVSIPHGYIISFTGETPILLKYRKKSEKKKKRVGINGTCLYQIVADTYPEYIYHFIPKNKFRAYKRVLHHDKEFREEDAGYTEAYNNPKSLTETVSYVHDQILEISKVWIKKKLESSPDYEKIDANLTKNLLMVSENEDMCVMMLVNKEGTEAIIRRGLMMHVTGENGTSKDIFRSINLYGNKILL